MTTNDCDNNGNDRELVEVIAISRINLSSKRTMVPQSSHLIGLKAKGREVAPCATLVHCYAHRLNLVLSQGVKAFPQAK